jgi:uncharacterized OB-fold protein
MREAARRSEAKAAERKRRGEDEAAQRARRVEHGKALREQVRSLAERGCFAACPVCGCVFVPPALVGSLEPRKAPQPA